MAAPSVARDAWHRHRGDLMLASIVLLAYWPLLLGWATIPSGDAHDCWLPWRSLIASILQDGALPQWNLWQQMGYPLHADLQGPAWYIEAIVLGGTVGMGPAVQQFLFLAYVIIGAWGIRRWLEGFGASATGALIGAAAYAMSGFITGHAMHQFAIISVAWLPWCLWAIQKLLAGPSWRSALRLALLASLQLTGGNHSLLILTAYPALAMVLFELWRGRSDTALTMDRLRWAFTAMLATVLLAAGTFHALLEVAPYVDRLKGLGLEQAQVNPFTWKALPSVVLPATATLGPEQLGTDPTMANAYVGAIALLLALVGTFRLERHSGPLMLALLAIPAFLAALGGATPVHGWLWSVLPGMDLFRFPGYFLYPVILGLIPLVAVGYDAVGDRLPRRVVGFGLLLLLLVGLISGTATLSFATLVDLVMSGTEPVPKPDGNAVLAMSLLLWAFTALSVLLAKCRWLLPLLALEGIVAVHATRWHTAMAPLAPAALNELITAYPTGPVLPALAPMAASRDGQGPVAPLWRNTRVFQGGPSHDGFNSFWLSQHHELVADHPNLFATMIARPVVALSWNVRAASAFSDERIDPQRERDIVLLDEGPTRVTSKGEGTLSVVDGDHQRLVLESSTTAPAFLLVQQNHYPGWQVRVDGAPVPVVRANVAAFGCWLPGGTHSVEVSYERPGLAILLQVQHLAWFTGLFLLLWKGPLRMVTLPVAAVGLMAWIFAVYGHRSKAAELDDGWRNLRAWGEQRPGITWVVNTDRPLPEQLPDMRSFRIDAPDRAEALAAVLQHLPDTVVYAWYGCMPTSAQRAWLARWYAAPVDGIEQPHVGAWLLVRSDRTAPAQMLHRDAGAVRLNAASPYGRAVRIPVDSLQGMGGEVVLRIRYQGDLSGKGRLVMEQGTEAGTQHYEAVPLQGPAGQDGWAEALLVRRTEALLPGTRWGAYVWYDGSDSLNVKDFEVYLEKIPH